MKINFKGLDFIKFVAENWKENSKPRYGRISRKKDFIIGLLGFGLLLFAIEEYRVRSELSKVIADAKLEAHQATLSMEQADEEIKRMLVLSEDNLKMLKEAQEQADIEALKSEKAKLAIVQLESDNDALKATIVAINSKNENYEHQIKLLEEVIKSDNTRNAAFRKTLDARLDKLRNRN